MSDKQDVPNPYNARNHEHSGPLGKDDVLAVASLMGQVAGSLGEIDKQNLGSGHITAKKINPKEALMNFVGSDPTAKLAPQPAPQPVPQPVPQQPVATVTQSNTVPVTPVQMPPSQVPSTDTTELENRIAALEKIVSTYKNIVKFKRGISYNITTSKISGTFKDVSTILDIVTTELAKQTKSIIIKLNDSTKNKQ